MKWNKTTEKVPRRRHNAVVGLWDMADGTQNTDICYYDPDDQSWHSGNASDDGWHAEYLKAPDYWINMPAPDVDSLID